MRNVEVKLELRDPELARLACRAAGARHVRTFGQVDTYYRVAGGRLKRRETEGASPEWIAYERADEARARVSAYSVYTEAAAQERFGARPLEVWVVVRKTRELWLHRNVRIHLDSVEGLGTFLELEAVVGGDYDEGACRRAVAAWRERLGPALGEPVAAGYAELLAGER